MILSHKGFLADSDLDGYELLALDMLRTSATLIKTAQRLGHLTADLRLTSKPIKPNKLGKVAGFQSGVVSGPADILAEVAFWKNGGAARCAEILGLANPDPGYLFDLFRGSMERESRNNLGDPPIWGQAGRVTNNLQRSERGMTVSMAYQKARRETKRKEKNAGKGGNPGR